MIAPCRSNLFTRAPPRAGRGRGRAPRSEIVSGGVRRSTRSPAVPTRTPAARQAATTGAGRPVELGAEQQAAAADLDDARQRREAGGEPLALRAHGGEQLGVDRLDDGARRRAGDRVAAERARVVAGLEPVRRAQSATRNAPIGRPLPRPFASVTASGATPSCSQAKKRARAADARLHLVEEEQRAVLVGERAGGGEELRRRRVDPALALDRLEQDRGRVGADRGGERIDVVQLREARGRRERLPGGALLRLPGDGERAVRPAVERVVERDDDRPPVTFRAHFSPASTASVPELQKNARAPPKRSESSSGEPLHRARSRRGSRRARACRAAPCAAASGAGCRWPSADDGDPAEQVEVALAGVVDEPGALAGGERRRPGARTRAAARSSCATLTRPPPSRRSRPGRRSRAAPSAARSFGTIPPLSAPSSSRRSASATPIDAETAPPSSSPGTSVTNRIRSAPIPTASAAAASSAFTFSGPAASGATTGTRPRRERVHDRGGRGGQRLADEPELRDVRRLQADLVAGERHRERADRRAELGVDRRERLADDVERLGRRHAAPADESAPRARARSISAEICSPAPWTTQTSLRAASAAHERRRVGRDRSADLDDDPAHVR